ncbi:snurportin-1-like [Hyalella azteca]|uniref:Snurportin-1 n=1 Tax=Hyalella azteca TaxID=294128 RepID=A0A8B7PN08_HYAAZ|nr:snurportin-1-like [Hyalella azteca]
MDEVLDSLNSFNVSSHHNSTHAEHPRFSNFKCKTSKSSQEARRKAVLAARSLARYDLLMHMRNVDEKLDPPTEISSSNTDSDVKDVIMEEVEMCYRRPKRYQDFLMLSEWLVEVPDTFASSYVVVPCPVGTRVLVVSGSGLTYMYGRNGKCMERFYSVLPGGCPVTSPRGYSMIDCIVSYETNTFYALDLIAWMNQSFMGCETQFRLQWLTSRLKESSPDPAVVSDDNAYRFVGLPHAPSTPENIQAMLQHPGLEGLPLDGLLFYHKEGHYTHGPTPLVGWLKAHMLPEILDVAVPEALMATRPRNYVSLPQHIAYGKQAREARLAANAAAKQQAQLAKNERRRQKNLAQANDMDTSGSLDSNASSSDPAQDQASSSPSSSEVPDLGDVNTDPR